MEDKNKQVTISFKANFGDVPKEVKTMLQNAIEQMEISSNQIRSQMSNDSFNTTPENPDYALYALADFINSLSATLSRSSDCFNILKGYRDLVLQPPEPAATDAPAINLSPEGDE